MPINASQVATLRAFLANDSATYDHLSARLDETDGWKGYVGLVGIALLEAVDRRFGDEFSDEEIIQVVAEARARFDDTGERLDPKVGERVLKAALTDHSTDDIDEELVARAKVMLLTTLVDQAAFTEADLDEFIRDVVDLYEEASA